MAEGGGSRAADRVDPDPSTGFRPPIPPQGGKRVRVTRTGRRRSRRCAWTSGVDEQVGRRRELDQVAQEHEAGVVGDPRRLLQVMGDDDDRVVLLQLDDRLLELGAWRSDRAPRPARRAAGPRARTAMPRATHRRCCWPPDRPRPELCSLSFTSSHRAARRRDVLDPLVHLRLGAGSRRAARRRRRCRRSTSGRASASGTPCRRASAALDRSTPRSRMFSPSSMISPSARWPG